MLPNRILLPFTEACGGIVIEVTHGLLLRGERLRETPLIVGKAATQKMSRRERGGGDVSRIFQCQLTPRRLRLLRKRRLQKSGQYVLLGICRNRPRCLAQVLRNVATPVVHLAMSQHCMLRGNSILARSVRPIRYCMTFHRLGQGAPLCGVSLLLVGLHPQKLLGWHPQSRRAGSPLPPTGSYGRHQPSPAAGSAYSSTPGEEAGATLRVRH
mmetsp:Transcript_35993/g.107599  ORF Transcript_35993/g.107599 Transcript_35993/m.107599 type:complete len:212 (-) Transcript_35993:2567-3202(-)